MEDHATKAKAKIDSGKTKITNAFKIDKNTLKNEADGIRNRLTQLEQHEEELSALDIETIPETHAYLETAQANVKDAARDAEGKKKQATQDSITKLRADTKQIEQTATTDVQNIGDLTYKQIDELRKTMNEWYSSGESEIAKIAADSAQSQTTLRSNLQTSVQSTLDLVNSKLKEQKARVEGFAASLKNEASVAGGSLKTKGSTIKTDLTGMDAKFQNEINLGLQPQVE